MFVVVVSMVMIIAISGLVVVYVAFPYRENRVPLVPWLGQAMDSVARAVALRMEPGTPDEERDLVHSGDH